jgi:hypothetical protein
MNNIELHSFTGFLGGALFEASTLVKTGMPKEMISAIHQKEEHRSERYKNLGKVFLSGRPVVLPYKFFRPSHEIEVPEPIVFTGKKVPPPAGSTRTAQYTDFAQYLQDLPNGPVSVLLTVPDKEVFLYLYYKQKWGGGPNAGGQQYAILAWDREPKKAVDMKLSGLTTEGVEKRLVRDVHQTKGGNTNAKVQEFINSLGEGAPRRNNPVYAYEFEVTQEPRQKRESRKAQSVPTSLDLIRVFAERYSNIMARAAEKNNKYAVLFSTNINGARGSAEASPEVSVLASKLGEDPGKTMFYLYDALKTFRKKIWEEGRGAYQKASGYDLENENAAANQIGIWNNYSFSTETVSTGTGSNREVRRDPVTGEYASIQSMVKAHGLEGVLHRFMFYLMSGRIDSPAVNVLALLGLDIERDSDLLQGLPDFENWTL